MIGDYGLPIAALEKAKAMYPKRMALVLSEDTPMEVRKLAFISIPMWAQEAAYRAVAQDCKVLLAQIGRRLEEFGVTVE